jgi:hypothetical protein
MTNQFWSGYAIEQENRDRIWATSYQLPFRASDSDLPDCIDPRSAPEFAQGWLRTEYQKMGGCQGYSLTENGEYNYTVATGKIEQFNPVVSYVMSQKYDGIDGDQGSTLDGGTTAAKDFGFCLHKIGLSEESYPRGGYRAVTKEMADDAAKRRLLSHTDIRDWSAAKTFLGSYMGLGQFGTKWTQGLSRPEANGVITSIQGDTLGGHAYTLAGYCAVELLPRDVQDSISRIRNGTKYKEVAIVKNSHSERWGAKGWGYLIIEFWEMMCKDNWTVILGRSDMETPEPRKSKVDFTKQEHTRYA